MAKNPIYQSDITYALTNLLVTFSHRYNSLKQKNAKTIAQICPKGKEMTTMMKLRNDDDPQSLHPLYFTYHTLSTLKCPILNSTLNKENAVNTTLLSKPD
jgi:hypothetical protein